FLTPIGVPVRGAAAAARRFAAGRAEASPPRRLPVSGAFPREAGALFAGLVAAGAGESSADLRAPLVA
ncbi:MAG: hypothetical protein ACR2FZ_09575, partial [Thermoleophilaceae bacterium]